MRTEENYDVFYSKIREKYSHREREIKFVNKLLTLITYFAYPAMAAYLFIKGDERLFKVVAVPAAGFIMLTVFRKAVNRSRPYEKFNINPIIKKDTKGQSMPSRHIYSITVIAMTFLYVMPALGIVFLVFALILAAVRVIGGVHYPTDVLAGFLLAIAAGYGVMMVLDIRLLHGYFPESKESPWAFLRWVDDFLPLALTGFCTDLGLFGHLLLVWMGPIGVQVKGLFYGAPYYDVPALLAFLSILITTVNFVVSVEVNFYPRYHTYYSLFNDGGVVGDLAAAEEEMLSVLNRELYYTALKQLFTTAAVISLEGVVLDALPLGFNDLMHGYFRTLCVGYGLYAVGNTVLLILLYFTDDKGAVLVSGLFAAAATLLTALSLAFDPAYYGFGFLLGAAVFLGAALLRLDAFTGSLPYRILGRQPMAKTEKTGWFTRLEHRLEQETPKHTLRRKEGS